jgi:hypothetical protein
MAEVAMERDLGRHDAEILALKEDVREMRSDLHAIREILAEARGGWRALVMASGVAGAVGALIAKVGIGVSWLK